MEVTKDVLKIAICDDEEIFLEKIKGLTEHYFTDKNIEVKIQCYQSVEEFLQSDLKSYQLILLDVNMGDINGIEVAHNIREHGIDTPIIYISAYIEMAPKGYTVGAFRYLLKGDLDTTFDDTMDSVMKVLKIYGAAIEIKTETQSQMLYLSDVRYIESFKRYVLIHTAEEEYKQYKKISDLEEQLHESDFLRIHKSYLVNMNYITHIKNRIAFLENDVELPCSRERYQEILERYVLWKGR